MRIIDLFIEAHHAHDDRSDTFAPIASHDTVRVFHGFRSAHEAVSTARHGLSGAMRADRVYSYEADNNPRGLFVSLSRKVAEQFVGAYGTRVIMEFNTLASELESPVWPGGSYTVQGQMAQYFGHGAEGRRNRNMAKRQEIPNAEPHVLASHDPLMVDTLTQTQEMQALFVGHLNPDGITAFWVEESRGHWVSYRVDDFLDQFGEANESKNPAREKFFRAGDDFDPEAFMEHVTEMTGAGAMNTLKSIWFRDIMSKPARDRAHAFVRTYDIFLWPKQYIPYMQWMRQQFGTSATK